MAHPEPIVVKTNLAEDPLISHDLFDSVQDLLAENHKTWIQNKTLVNEFLGAGLLYCSCGCRMYHKVTNHDGKQWAYYICSGRYTKKTDCRQQILAARGEYSADQLIAHELDVKFADPGFVQARIQEALAARDTDETRRNLVAAKAEVKELEDQQENFAVAIASTKNTSVTKMLVRKMEALDTEIALARTKARQAAKAVSSAIDPVAAEETIRAAFKGFHGLPTTEQKAILNEYVSRIDFIPPSCAGDISAMFHLLHENQQLWGMQIGNTLLRAFMEEVALPVTEVGPVDFCALRRLPSI